MKNNNIHWLWKYSDALIFIISIAIMILMLTSCEKINDKPDTTITKHNTRRNYQLIKSENPRSTKCKGCFDK